MADGDVAAVGSANLTPRSMLTSKELTVFAHGKPDCLFIAELRKQIDADLAKSAEVKEGFKLSFMDRINAIVGKYVW